MIDSMRKKLKGDHDRLISGAQSPRPNKYPRPNNNIRGQIIISGAKSPEPKHCPKFYYYYKIY
jgi:hypothetical protein